MIKYEGGDECDLFKVDFEAEDERSWGVVRRRRIFLELQTLPHILFELHYPLLGLFALFLKICMVWIGFELDCISYGMSHFEAWIT